MAMAENQLIRTSVEHIRECSNARTVLMESAVQGQDQCNTGPTTAQASKAPTLGGKLWENEGAPGLQEILCVKTSTYTPNAK